MSRMVRPEAVNVKITGGDWILLKKRLTAGETRAMLHRGMREDGRGVDVLRIGHAKALAYLLDWSLLDPANQPIVIREKAESVVGAALDSLDPDSFNEIVAAVVAHEAAMEAERAQEKKLTSGSLESGTSSLSVVA